MAVELCKVALWIEALEPGKPLTFLDGRILCGDSLLGIFDPNFQTLLDGLPDEAFDPLTGDDKTTAQTIKKINKSWREDKAATGGIIEKYLAPESIRNEAVIVDAMPENNIKEIRAKSRAWKKLEENSNHIMLRQACDTYVAAFLLPKVGEVPESNEVDALGIPTTNTIWSLLRSKECPEQLLDRCTDVARKNFAFHWPLAFPSVMARGGFDVVIGNPPWERIKLQEVEFFSTRHSEIAAASNKAEKKPTNQNFKVC